MPDSTDHTRPHRNAGSDRPTPARDGKERRPLKVNLPDKLPVLTPEVSRILLGIIWELAEKNGWRSRTRPRQPADSNEDGSKALDR